MRIALITDDGKTISRHFGRASHYFVALIEDGQVRHTELREKLGHAHFGAESHTDEPGHRHGFGPQAHERHAQMAGAINDCQVLVCGGMGAGAYQAMLASGIQPVVTDVGLINDAIQAYVEGRLQDHTDLLH